MPMRSHIAFRPRFPTCSICNEAVELEKQQKLMRLGSQRMKNAACNKSVTIRRSGRPAACGHLTMTKNPIFQCPDATSAGIRIS